MSIFGNITFAIVSTEDSWRTDLTLRFCEYFNRKINGPNGGKVLIVKGPDEAINRSTMGYVAIFYSGYIPFSMSFFKQLDQRIQKNSDIFLGDIVLADDYATLDKSFIFVNKTLWTSLGSPAYNQKHVKDGPGFDVSIPTIDRDRPQQIVAKDENVFVPGVCGLVGAELIIRQLEIFKSSDSLNNIIMPDVSHHLLSSRPIEEIRSETKFEKLFLQKLRSHVYLGAENVYDYSNPADIVVAPAHGLRALTLVENTGAKRVVIYANNQYELEFQKIVFSQRQATTYANVVSQFQMVFPEASVNDWHDDMYTLVSVIPSHIKIEYRLVDIVSFEAEELVKSIDRTQSLVIDFSDVFVQPYIYYHRSLAQVQGLFAELYSLLKSRTGSTKIIGYAPGYRRLDTVEVNPSNDK